ncbi:acyl-CoA dehydrogenase family protein [Streptomyces olivaceus]|uniref:acyl-CoA dehydrogenase family protein n=1 Tax=Streptomyces olivaceus TaxID=47716 RepID=UPI0036B0F4F2
MKLTPTVPDRHRLEEAIRRVAEVAVTCAADVDREARFPAEALRAARKTGLLGLLVPREHGGLGGTLYDVVEMAMRLGASCLSAAMILVMHAQQVDAVTSFASPQQRDTLLPEIAKGDLYLGSVTTEEIGGGHLLSGVSALREVDDGFELHRRAPIVTGAEHADGFLIKVRSGSKAAEGDLSLVYLPRDELDVSVTSGWDASGMRGVGNRAMTLAGKLDTSRFIGGRGRFTEIAVESFAPVAHLGWAGSWLGAARECWSHLLACLRAPGAGADLRSPLTAERVARVRGRLEAISAYLHTVLDEVMDLRLRGEPLNQPATQIHLNTMKVLAAEESAAAAQDMVRLAGLDLGYRRDSPVPLERLLRDLTAASLTYSDTRLLLANGALSVLDPQVTLAGDRSRRGERKHWRA